MTRGPLRYERMDMRRRIDKNQREVVNRLRSLGFSVQLLSGVGKGCPDLLIGWHGQNFLIELKSGKKWTTEDEANWLSEWKGQAAVCTTVDEILAAIVANVFSASNGVPLKIGLLRSMFAKNLEATGDGDSSDS